MTELQTVIHFFSATGSTCKIVDAVADGLGGGISRVNFTCPQNRGNGMLVEADLLILACPVYGERIPGFIRRYLEGLRGNQTNLAAIAVYGNVTSGISLTQFDRIARKNNFHLIGAGAFIGQHSFANADNRVGWGRPDRQDLEEAKAFGLALSNKIAAGNPGKIELPPARLPLFIQNFPENGTRRLVSPPRIDPAVCRHCGICVEHCPVEAIDANSLRVDETLCVRCLGCVKICPAGARKARFRTDLFNQVFKSMAGKPKQNQFIV